MLECCLGVYPIDIDRRLLRLTLVAAELRTHPGNCDTCPQLATQEKGVKLSGVTTGALRDNRVLGAQGGDGARRSDFDLAPPRRLAGAKL